MSQVKPLGPRPVKGLDEPLEVYEVIGVRHRRSRLQAAAARGLTRFVGRDKEIEQLCHGSTRRKPAMVRLLRSLASLAWESRACSTSLPIPTASQDWLIVECGSVSYGKATPYLPVVDLLKAYFKIQDRDNIA